MKLFEGVTKRLLGFMTMLLVALAAGCGGGGGGGSSGGGGTPAATDRAFSAFSLSGVTATVNESAKTIAVTVPNGTNVTALVATFAITGGSVKVGATAQTSGVTANDFTAPVAYVITAADGSTSTYTVTTTVASASAKSISAFSLGGAAGTINEVAKTIAVSVPNGTAVNALIATFSTTGASVKVGATVQASGVTANDFTTPVAYLVTAADASTTTYLVTVTISSNSAKAITAYSFAGYTGATGVINEAAKTIAVTVPNGTAVSALIATFTTTGANVKVGAATQTSATTANNFTAPVAYLVTAADTSSVTYTVTVTVAANSAKAITAYSFAGFSDSAGTINEGLKTIAVAVPPGTTVTALTATFATTGANVKVGAALQTSTATANDFTAPVTYRVTAADASFVDYVVTVTPGTGPAPVLLGYAENFTILTQSGITDVPSSAITGNIGTSPIAGSFIGVTCAEIASGNIYEVDATYVGVDMTCVRPGTTGGTPNADKTFVDNAVGVGGMGGAYTDAAGRPAGVGPFLNLGGGTIANQTLAAGVYTFTGASSNVTITTNLTLNGGANDVWIFQIPGTLGISPNMQVLLTGGALAKNVFWVVAGAVTLNTTSHFEGVILAQTNIAMLTGATINGRLLAQTAATLQSNTVTPPP